MAMMIYNNVVIMVSFWYAGICDTSRRGLCRLTHVCLPDLPDRQRCVAPFKGRGRTRVGLANEVAFSVVDVDSLHFTDLVPLSGDIIDELVEARPAALKLTVSISEEPEGARRMDEAIASLLHALAREVPQNNAGACNPRFPLARPDSELASIL
jgi:hypothetical protein